MATERRLKACIKEWPDCYEGGYDPSCCRFPKSCSCTVYPDGIADDKLEPAGLSGAPATTAGPDEMPLIWWSPEHGLLWRPSGYDHIENPDNKTYFYELPADAVELRPVDDA